MASRTTGHCISEQEAADIKTIQIGTMWEELSGPNEVARKNCARAAQQTTLMLATNAVIGEVEEQRRKRCVFLCIKSTRRYGSLVRNR